MKHCVRSISACLTIFLSCFVVSARAQERSQAGSPTAVPKRIVSLAPSVTETLFALGFGNRLVGATTHCDYPPEAQRLPKIGGFMSPSIEAIVASRPDLVIGVSSATDRMKAREMERLGLRVTLITLGSLSDIFNSINSLSLLMGNPEAGEKLAGKIGAQIQDVKQRVGQVPPRSVLLVVGIRPLVAVGGKNFIDELITLAGGKNIAANVSQPWLNLPDEYVLAKAPDVIIQAGMGSEREAPAKHWGDLDSIPAVRERRVYSYPGDKILRPGPRVGEGLQEIARLVHPECFRASKDGLSRGRGCDGSRP
jgi:iron complex transport system substrate-binding protein